MSNRIQYQFTAGTADFDKAVDNIEKNMRQARNTFNRELRGINTDLVGTEARMARMAPAVNDSFGSIGPIIARGVSMASLAIVGAVAGATYAMFRFAADSKQVVMAHQASFRGLESVANHAGVGIGRAMAEAEKLSADGLMTVADASRALQNLLSRGYDVDEAVATIDRLKDAAAFNRQATLGMSEAVVTATEGLKNENSILVDNAGVTKNVSKMWEEYAKTIGTTRDNLTQSQKIQAEVLGIMKETTAQIGNAEKASVGLMGSQTRLDKSSYDLKVTIGTILEPAFTSLNNVLSATAKLFNDIFKSAAGISRGIPEIESDIASLEARLEGMNSRRRAGVSKSALEGELEDLRSELTAARLTSDDAEQVGAGIAVLTQRIAEQQQRVEAAAEGGTKREVGGGRSRRLTEYGRELAALESLQGQLQKATQRREELNAAINDDKPESETTSPSTPGKSKSRTGQWTEVLDAQKVAHQQQQAEQGTFHQFSAQKEMEYWQGILQRDDLTAAERLTVQRNYLAALTADRRQAEGTAFADLQAQAQQYRTNMEARLAIAQQTLERSAQLYGTDSQEYQRAAMEIVAIEREKAQQLQQIKQNEIEASQNARLADIAHAEQMAQFALQEGLVTQQQMLAAQKDFEDQRYAIEAAALEQRRLLLENDPDRNPVALQQIHQQMQELEQQHRNSVSAIQQQQTMEARSNWNGMLGSMQQSWTNGLNGILTGTMSTEGLMRGIFASIGTAFVENMVTKPLMAWMFGEAAKTSATVTGVATRGAAEEAGAMKSVLLWAGAAIKNILTSAYQAMAGAFAAMSAIPVVGPALGVAAAAAAGAFVFGLVKNVASAEGGYDIPAGTNPLTQLHEQEMVLPKQYANVIRRAADGDGGLGGGGGDTIHYNDHTGRLTPSEIRRNVGVIAAELQRLRRNNGLKTP
ncbi:MAG: hypothetical protein JKY26_17425 [Pseudomonas sp.]|nr:hypothetical protein [Pseudomonas sp.]